MLEKMRVTTHNGRMGKDGAYSVKHNDRKFETKDSAHIDSSLTSQNQEWKFDTETIGKTSSFEEHEQKFYEHYFSSALEQRNERARISRHTERVQTMEQYRKNKRACPEETILQIGCAGNTVDVSMLKSVCEEYMQWHMETYPNVKLLDAALHVDEPNAAPHLHLRRVWTIEDKEGNLSISQSKALEQLGIERPNLQKKKDRYNNPKVVFTQQCREKFIAICESHGIDVEHIPLEPSKSGLSHDEYIRRKEQEKTELARKELQELQEQIKLIREMQVTTQSVTEKIQTRKGFLSKNITVTIPQSDFDILLQQAQAYIVNRDEIEKLRDEKIQLTKKQSELEHKESELQEREQKIHREENIISRLKKQQENINELLEEIEQENKQLRRNNRSLKVDIDNLKGEVKNALSKYDNLQQEYTSQLKKDKEEYQITLTEKDKKIDEGLKRVQMQKEKILCVLSSAMSVLLALQNFTTNNQNLLEEEKLLFRAMENLMLKSMSPFNKEFYSKAGIEKICQKIKSEGRVYAKLLQAMIDELTQQDRLKQNIDISHGSMRK